MILSNSNEQIDLIDFSFIGLKAFMFDKVSWIEYGHIIAKLLNPLTLNKKSYNVYLTFYQPYQKYVNNPKLLKVE